MIKNFPEITQFLLSDYCRLLFIANDQHVLTVFCKKLLPEMKLGFSLIKAQRENCSNQNRTQNHHRRQNKTRVVKS